MLVGAAHAGLITGGQNSKEDCDWWWEFAGNATTARDHNTPEPTLVKMVMASGINERHKILAINVIALVYSSGDFDDLSPTQAASEVQGECIASKTKW